MLEYLVVRLTLRQEAEVVERYVYEA